VDEVNCVEARRKLFVCIRVRLFGLCSRNHTTSNQVRTRRIKSMPVFCIRLFQNVISDKKSGQKLGSCVDIASWAADPISFVSLKQAQGSEIYEPCRLVMRPD
jgi:hypothetical protein